MIFWYILVVFCLNIFWLVVVGRLVWFDFWCFLPADVRHGNHWKPKTGHFWRRLRWLVHTWDILAFLFCKRVFKQVETKTIQNARKFQLMIGFPAWIGFWALRGNGRWICLNISCKHLESACEMNSALLMWKNHCKRQPMGRRYISSLSFPLFVGSGNVCRRMVLNCIALHCLRSVHAPSQSDVFHGVLLVLCLVSMFGMANMPPAFLLCLEAIFTTHASTCNLSVLFASICSLAFCLQLPFWKV